MSHESSEEPPFFAKVGPYWRYEIPEEGKGRIRAFLADYRGKWLPEPGNGCPSDEQVIWWLSAALAIYKSYRHATSDGGRESKTAIRESLEALESGLADVDRSISRVIGLLGGTYDRMSTGAMEKLETAFDQQGFTDLWALDLWTSLHFPDPLRWIRTEGRRRLAEVQDWARAAHQTTGVAVGLATSTGPRRGSPDIMLAWRCLEIWMALATNAGRSDAGPPAAGLLANFMNLAYTVAGETPRNKSDNTAPKVIARWKKQSRK
jgi:hypothetical protein